MTFRFRCFCAGWLLLAGLLEFPANAKSLVLATNAPRVLPRRASIILIVADGLGYGDLSCYGQKKFQTPNLDKLAAEGARFTNYSAGTGLTDPAAVCAALVLGHDVSRLRRRAGADVALGPDDITVAQVLKNAGYHTGLIGEWELGGKNATGAPWKKGFDEFAGYLNPTDAENFYADYVFRYAPHSIFDRTNRQFNAFVGREMVYPNSGGHKGQFIPDLLTKAAANFIRDNQPDRFNHYRPFFLLLNYKIPGNGREAVPTDAPFSEEPWPQPERNRAAMIARLDNYIGQLRQQWQQSGMTNNLAVFFTSDAPARKGGGVDPAFFHSNLGTNNLRVPMIVHWPGHVPAGTVSRFKWSARDFLPTAAGIGFARTPEGVNGFSLLSADAKEISR